MEWIFVVSIAAMVSPIARRPLAGEPSTIWLTNTPPGVICTDRPSREGLVHRGVLRVHHEHRAEPLLLDRAHVADHLGAREDVGGGLQPTGERLPEDRPTRLRDRHEADAALVGIGLHPGGELHELGGVDRVAGRVDQVARREERDDERGEQRDDEQRPREPPHAGQRGQWTGLRFGWLGNGHRSTPRGERTGSACHDRPPTPRHEAVHPAQR